MSGDVFTRCASGRRFGVKGPRAADWLRAAGFTVPAAPNTWVEAAAAQAPRVLVARLGSAEFFVEEAATETPGSGAMVPRTDVAAWPAGELPPGVYPVLREDAAFSLAGEGVLEVLAQVCNVDFGALDLAARPIVMTLMIGVAVLVVPPPPAAMPCYRIWCDPTFGSYLEESLRNVVVESGGHYSGEST